MPPIPESDRCLWASLPNQSTALRAERRRTSLLERGVGREATDVKAKAANTGDSAARGLRPRPHAEGKPRCPGGGHKAPTTRPPLPTAAHPGADAGPSGRAPGSPPTPPAQSEPADLPGSSAAPAPPGPDSRLISGAGRQVATPSARTEGGLHPALPGRRTEGARAAGWFSPGAVSAARLPARLPTDHPRG